MTGPGRLLLVAVAGLLALVLLATQQQNRDAPEGGLSQGAVGVLTSRPIHTRSGNGAQSTVGPRQEQRLHHHRHHIRSSGGQQDQGDELDPLAQSADQPQEDPQADRERGVDPHADPQQGQQDQEPQRPDGQGRQQGSTEVAQRPTTSSSSSSSAWPKELYLRTSALPASALTLDVWVLAGQSNMVGENGYDGEPWPHPLGDPWPGRMLMYPNSTGVWQDAEENMHAMAAGCFTGQCKGTGMGPALAFGRALVDLGLSHRVGFVPTARGGTSLAWDWRAPDGLRFQHMVNVTLAAMLAASVIGGGAGSAQLRGVLWVQGETDASPLVGGAPREHALQYGRRLHALIEATRSALRAHHPLLPFVVVKMSTAGRQGALPYIEDVRRQQEEVAHLPAVISADMQGLKFFTADLGKDLGGPTDMHLTKSGACQLGLHMAQQYAMSGQQLIRPTEPQR